MNHVFDKLPPLPHPHEMLTAVPGCRGQGKAPNLADTLLHKGGDQLQASRTVQLVAFRQQPCVLLALGAGFKVLEQPCVHRQMGQQDLRDFRCGLNKGTTVREAQIVLNSKHTWG